MSFFMTNNTTWFFTSWIILISNSTTIQTGKYVSIVFGHLITDPPDRFHPPRSFFGGRFSVSVCFAHSSQSQEPACPFFFKANHFDICFLFWKGILILLTPPIPCYWFSMRRKRLAILVNNPSEKSHEYWIFIIHLVHIFPDDSCGYIKKFLYWFVRRSFICKNHALPAILSHLPYCLALGASVIPSFFQ